MVGGVASVESSLHGRLGSVGVGIAVTSASHLRAARRASIRITARSASVTELVASDTWPFGRFCGAMNGTIGDLALMIRESARESMDYGVQSRRRALRGGVRHAVAQTWQNQPAPIRSISRHSPHFGHSGDRSGSDGLFPLCQGLRAAYIAVCEACLIACLPTRTGPVRAAPLRRSIRIGQSCRRHHIAARRNSCSRQVRKAR